MLRILAEIPRAQIKSQVSRLTKLGASLRRRPLEIAEHTRKLNRAPLTSSATSKIEPFRPGVNVCSVSSSTANSAHIFQRFMSSAASVRMGQKADRKSSQGRCKGDGPQDRHDSALDIRYIHHPDLLHPVHPSASVLSRSSEESHDDRCNCDQIRGRKDPSALTMKYNRLFRFS